MAQNVRKSLSRALLITMLFGGLALAGALKVSAEAPGLIVIISSDTTWTKTNSPYNLTAAVLVNTGAVLTIEAGVTVNLNDYEMRVDGTLCALGSSTDPVHFNGGNITFTQYSDGWDEHAGSGCIIDHAVIDQTYFFSGGNSLKISNSDIKGVISYSDDASIYVGESSVISNSNIEGIITVGESTVISNNNITGKITGNAIIISNNNIVGARSYTSNIAGGLIELHTAIDVKGGTSVISNNTIIGEIYAVKSRIVNNTITGGGPAADWVGRPMDSRSAIRVTGNSVISDNIITDRDGGHGITIKGDGTSVSGNIIYDFVLCIRAAADSVIDGNLIINDYGGIGIEVGRIESQGWDDSVIGEGNVIIRNNTITNCYTGIRSRFAGGSATIERNLIFNNTANGIDIASQATIQRNTISNSAVAIRLDDCPSVTISYNNIENCIENSVYLEGTSSNVDATNNWWGTTDTQKINMSILDFKYDFNLGKVTFIPFLTEPNPEAPPIQTPIIPEFTVIPEFPSWIILPLFMVATAIVITYRKKLKQKATH